MGLKFKSSFVRVLCPSFFRDGQGDEEGRCHEGEGCPSCGCSSSSCEARQEEGHEGEGDEGKSHEEGLSFQFEGVQSSDIAFVRLKFMLSMSSSHVDIHACERRGKKKKKKKKKSTRVDTTA